MSLFHCDSPNEEIFMNVIFKKKLLHNIKKIKIFIMNIQKMKLKLMKIWFSDWPSVGYNIILKKE